MFAVSSGLCFNEIQKLISVRQVFQDIQVMLTGIIKTVWRTVWNDGTYQATVTQLLVRWVSQWSMLVSSVHLFVTCVSYVTALQVAIQQQSLPTLHTGKHWSREKLIKLWKSSASGSGSRIFLTDSSILHDVTFFQLFTFSTSWGCSRSDGVTFHCTINKQLLWQHFGFDFFLPISSICC